MRETVKIKGKMVSDHGNTGLRKCGMFGNIHTNFRTNHEKEKKRIT